MLKTKLMLPGLALALVGSAFAQGDDCSTATAINTVGAFPFDTTALTTTNFDGTGSCNNGGSATINQDGFWQWTAPAAGDYIFDTLGSTFDTKMSVHTGVGCAATCTGYNDDTGGLQSQVTVAGVNAGDLLLIQVGGFGTASGTGDLNVRLFVDPCTLSEDALEENDDCASAVPLAVGVHPNLWASDTDADFYSFTVQAFEVVTVNPTINAGDIDINVMTGACNALGTVAGGFTYTNTTGQPEDIVFECFVNATTGGSTCASYDLDVSLALDPCQTAPDDSFEDNDDCATAAAVVDGTHAGLFVGLFDKDHYSFCVADGDTVTIDLIFLNANGDLDGFLRDASSVECGNGNGAEELADGFSANDNENITWTNNTGADLDVVLEVNVYVNSTSQCNDYDMIISGANGCGNTSTGTVFCDPAVANSTGAPAVLAGAFGSGVGSDLHLEITGGVPGQLAYFLVGNEATAGVSISNGLFCLVGTGTAQFFRYNVAATDMNSIGGFDASGTMVNAVSTSTTGFGFDVPSTIPAGTPTTITAGDTWHFQGWYRDTPAGVGSSNFTNGLSVTF